MRKLVITLCFVLTLCFASICSADSGVITYVDNDLIIVETEYGDYTCAELMTVTPYMYAGDVIYGTLNAYGIYDWYNREADAEFRVYINEYWLRGNEALRWLQEKRT